MQTVLNPSICVILAVNPFKQLFEQIVFPIYWKEFATALDISYETVQAKSYYGAAASHDVHLANLLDLIFSRNIGVSTLMEALKDIKKSCCNNSTPVSISGIKINVNSFPNIIDEIVAALESKLDDYKLNFVLKGECAINVFQKLRPKLDQTESLDFARMLGYDEEYLKSQLKTANDFGYRTFTKEEMVTQFWSIFSTKYTGNNSIKTVRELLEFFCGKKRWDCFDLIKNELGIVRTLNLEVKRPKNQTLNQTPNQSSFRSEVVQTQPPVFVQQIVQQTFTGGSRTNNDEDVDMSSVKEMSRKKQKTESNQFEGTTIVIMNLKEPDLKKVCFGIRKADFSEEAMYEPKTKKDLLDGLKMSKVVAIGILEIINDCGHLEEEEYEELTREITDNYSGNKHEWIGTKDWKGVDGLSPETADVLVKKWNEMLESMSKENSADKKKNDLKKITDQSIGTNGSKLREHFESKKGLHKLFWELVAKHFKYEGLQLLPERVK